MILAPKRSPRAPASVSAISAAASPPCSACRPRPMSNSCNWPVAATIPVRADWRSGYHDVALTDAKGETAHHFICVKAGVHRQRMVLVLATNTLHAYNYWGGASAYCHVESLMRREKTLAE